MRNALTESLHRVAPKPDPEPEVAPAPDPWDVIAARLAEASAPTVHVDAPVVEVPAVDLTALVDAIAASRVDQAALARAVSDGVAAGVRTALERQSDFAGPLEAVVRELESLRKKMNTAVRGGSGSSGSSTEVSLRVGTDKMPVSDENPMPVALVSDAALHGIFDYRAGTNGSESMAANEKVTSITAVALGAQGSLTINGGDTILLPYDATDKASSAITLPVSGDLRGAEVIFDANVDAYFIELEVF